MEKVKIKIYDAVTNKYYEKEVDKIEEVEEITVSQDEINFDFDLRMSLLEMM